LQSVFDSINWKDGKTTAQQTEFLFGLVCDKAREVNGETNFIYANLEQILQKLPLNLIKEDVFVCCLAEFEQIDASETSSNTNTIAKVACENFRTRPKGLRKVVLAAVDKDQVKVALRYEDIMVYWGQCQWQDASSDELGEVMQYLTELSQESSLSKDDIQQLYSKIPLEKMSADDLAKLSYTINNYANMHTINNSAKLLDVEYVINLLNSKGMKVKGLQVILKMVLENLDTCRNKIDEVLPLWSLGSWNALSERSSEEHQTIAVEALECFHEIYSDKEYQPVNNDWDNLYRILPWGVILSCERKKAEKAIVNSRCNLLLTLDLVAANTATSTNTPTTDIICFKLVLDYCAKYAEKMRNSNDEIIKEPMQDVMLLEAWGQKLNWKIAGGNNKNQSLQTLLESEFYPQALSFLTENAVADDEGWSFLFSCLDIEKIPTTFFTESNLIRLDVLKSKFGSLDKFQQVVLKRTLFMSKEEEGIVLDEETLALAGPWDDCSAETLKLAYELILLYRVSKMNLDSGSGNSNSSNSNTTTPSYYPEFSEDPSEDVATRCALQLPLNKLSTEELWNKMDCANMTIINSNDIDSDYTDLPVLLKNKNLTLKHFHPIYALLQKLDFKSKAIPSFVKHCELYRTGMKADNTKFENLFHSLVHRFSSDDTILSSDDSGSCSDAKTLGKKSTLPLTPQDTKKIFMFFDEFELSAEQIMPFLEYLDVTLIPRGLYNKPWVDKTVLMEARMELFQTNIEQKMDKFEKRMMDSFERVVKNEFSKFMLNMQLNGGGGGAGGSALGSSKNLTSIINGSANNADERAERATDGKTFSPASRSQNFPRSGSNDDKIVKSSSSVFEIMTQRNIQEAKDEIATVKTEIENLVRAQTQMMSKMEESNENIGIIAQGLLAKDGSNSGNSGITPPRTKSGEEGLTAKDGSSVPTPLRRSKSGTNVETPKKKVQEMVEKFSSGGKSKSKEDLGLGLTTEQQNNDTGANPNNPSGATTSTSQRQQQIQQQQQQINLQQQQGGLQQGHQQQQQGRQATNSTSTIATEGGMFHPWGLDNLPAASAPSPAPSSCVDLFSNPRVSQDASTALQNLQTSMQVPQNSMQQGQNTMQQQGQTQQQQQLNNNLNSGPSVQAPGASPMDIAGGQQMAAGQQGPQTMGQQGHQQMMNPNMAYNGTGPQQQMGPQMGPQMEQPGQFGPGGLPQQGFDPQQQQNQFNNMQPGQMQPGQQPQQQQQPNSNMMNYQQQGSMMAGGMASGGMQNPGMMQQPGMQPGGMFQQQQPQQPQPPQQQSNLNEVMRNPELSRYLTNPNLVKQLDNGNSSSTAAPSSAGNNFNNSSIGNTTAPAGYRDPSSTSRDEALFKSTARKDDTAYQKPTNTSSETSERKLQPQPSSNVAREENGKKVYWGRIVSADVLPEGVAEFLPTVRAEKAKVGIKKPPGKAGA